MRILPSWSTGIKRNVGSTVLSTTVKFNLYVSAMGSQYAMLAPPSGSAPSFRPDAAMACTAAVETEIDKHYADQLDALGDSDPELSAAIADFQAEELEHRDHALAAGAENAFGYPVMSAVIRLGCKVAIAAAKRI